jgi:hypothetical protein
MLLGRIYAGIYESPGATGGHFRVLTSQVLFIGAFSWLMRMTGMIAWMPMLFSMLMGTQLKDTFPYPMSRRERADAFFAASMLDSIVSVAMAAGGVALLWTLGLWRDDNHHEGPGYYLMGLLFLFLLYPIGQVAQVRRSLTPTRKNKVPATTMMVAMVVLLSWFGIAMGAAKIFGGSITSAPPAVTLITLVVSFVAIQSVYLIGLRWYFARRDYP